MINNPEISSCNIVLIGDFNPKIFTPDWLLAQEIISQQEKDACEIEVIHSEVSKITCEWFILEVTKKRFIIETTEAPFVRILDFTNRVFGDILIHTPITMIGINRRLHFTMNQDRLDIIGTALAPQSAWGEWANKIDGGDDPKKHGGLRLITMEQNNLEDRDNGHLRASVQPSTLLKGLFIDINDQYELSDGNNALECVSLLSDVFENSITRSEWVADQVLKIG